jgi:hypothetical protein
MVAINQSMGVLLIAFIPLIVGAVFIIREIIKQKKIELILFLGIIISISFSYFSGVMVHYLLIISPDSSLLPFWKIGTLIHFIPVSIFSILIVDALKRESVEPWKLGFTLFLSGLLFYVLFEPNSFTVFPYSNGDLYLGSNTNQTIASTSLLIWSASVFFYYSILLIIKSPPKTKKYAYTFLISLLLIAIGPEIALFHWVQLPHIDALSNSLGFLMFAYVFSKHPELFYILPFKVLRLTVVDMKSGISLYDHTWKQNPTILSKEVYSGFLQGVRVIIKESMNQGDISEIRTNDAVLLFEIIPETELTFVLASTKSSFILKKALKRFAVNFCKINADFLDKRAEIDLLEHSNEIFDEVFQFLP